MTEQNPEATEAQEQDTTQEAQDGPQKAPEGSIGETTLTDADRAAMTQQEASAKPALRNERETPGYIGTLPDEGNRPDLTLAGVLGQAQTAPGSEQADDDEPEQQG